jgi:hypothetical protein
MPTAHGRVGHGEPGENAPVSIGGKAVTAVPTAVEANDAVNAYFDVNGRQVVSLQPMTVGGLTTHKTVAAGSTNATVVKASAGQVYGIQVNNVNAAVRYLKLYNKATAPSVGTDVPVKTLAIPAASVQQFHWPAGIAFAAGISFATTTEATDGGTTGISASESVINIDYA